MEQKKIVYEGLCCRIKGKAALVDFFMRAEPELFGEKILRVLTRERRKDIFEVNAVGNMAMLSIAWNDERKEQIFDLLVREKEMDIDTEESDLDKLLMVRPLLEWNQKDIHVDSIPYLVYAIVRNERCKSALKKLNDEKAGKCYAAFAESDYVNCPFLYWFLQEEKHLVKLAWGMLLLVRKGQNGEEWYRVFMNILYQGYKPLKNIIKKWSCFCGDNFLDFYTDQDDMIKSMSVMMTELVIAQDLGLQLKFDYHFYIVVLGLKDFERDMLEGPSGDLRTEEGKKRYLEMKMEYPKLESCNACIYMDGGKDVLEEERDNQARETAEALVESREGPDPMETLFTYFQLHPRMFAAIELKRQEIELIFSLFEKLDWEKYQQWILIASMCRYIQNLHRICEENCPEVLAYQNAQARKQIGEQQAEIDRLTEKAACLERQQEKFKEMLEQQEIRKEKLQKTLRKMSEQYAGEKEELILLRNFVYQMGGESEIKRKNRNSAGVLEKIRKEKVIVVGGHEHWRSKMKEIFPEGLFLAGNNNNFDVSVLKNKRYIIINTDILKHSSYYRIVKEKKKEQTILYVHGNNMDRCRAELERQMASM